MTKYKPMHNKIIVTILLVIFLVRISIAQEPLPATEKYTFENCINKFDMNKTVKTSAGSQYWFIEQKFLDDNLTVKMSVVAPKQATHAPHKHPGDETFFILEGTAQFYLNGKTTTGGPLTSFYCPVGSEHGISNAGDTELKYLVIRKYVE
jgi:quercetin dioxygenase-like cupin family protein